MKTINLMIMHVIQARSIVFKSVGGGVADSSEKSLQAKKKMCVRADVVP